MKSWARRHGWDEAPSIRKLEDCLETRLMVLICKEKKTGADYTEPGRAAPPGREPR
ncbi:hypothetical protein QP162_13245 [Sphingomonas aurantiaca]|uniref:terminase gpP N-terminus-related DNA-binding protein n=1 Tax=Sphingomonas aurantiaca TaxID=185949 RepID=UPI002FE3BE6A